jgi:hypothetical protein
LPRNKEFGCKGFNYTVTLGSDRMIIEETKWGRPSSHELLIQSINAVIVRRKSIVPFAAFTTLALIAAVLMKYNSLWFFVNLSPKEEGAFSAAALTVAVLFAIPAMSRAFFVDVIISCAARPKPFLVRLVPAKQGRRLVKRFHGISTGP